MSNETERICQLERELETTDAALKIVKRELADAQSLLITYGQQLTAAHVALTIIMDHSLEDNYLHKVAAKALGHRESQ